MATYPKRARPGTFYPSGRNQSVGFAPEARLSSELFQAIELPHQAGDMRLPVPQLYSKYP